MAVPATFRDRPYAAEHFQGIVKHARETNPFYREWISDPENVPILPRSVFVENNDRILNGLESNGKTSGSTGRPVRFCIDPERRRLNAVDNMRFREWIGGHLLTLYLVSPSPDKSPKNLFSVLRPVREQLDFMLSCRGKLPFTAVTTVPTNAELLCREVLDRGANLSFVSRFGMISEAVEPRHFDLARRAFPHAKIWSTYSSEEFGMIAAQCPFEPEFQHLMSPKLGIEVLRPDGTPCAEGERGEVVVTDYFNRATPFIRYAIGDLAEPRTCPCGRIPWPSLGRVAGKIRGTVLHREGHRSSFSDVRLGLAGLPSIRQYQITQVALDRFSVKLVAEPGPELERRITEQFISYLGHPVTVDLAFVDSIPRLPNGKYPFIISDL